VEPLEISADQLEPDCFATSLDASHDMLKPRRKPVGSMIDKASNVLAKASGKTVPSPSTGVSRKRKHDATREPVAQGASQQTAAFLNPLDPP
jgi:hypothetical protein